MPAPAKPLARVSGGNPNGIPDFRPMNPWGRAMPRISKTIRAPLYQLVVTRRGRGQTPFGPKMEKSPVMALYDAVMEQIRAGTEKEITDPHVVLCV